MLYGREYFEKIHDVSKEGKVISEERVALIFPRVSPLARALDVGCGFGDTLLALERRGVGAWGVDVSSYALAVARKRGRTRLVKVDVEKERLPFASGFFDVVTLFDVVEHLSSPEHLFSEVFRVLRRGGVVFLTTPNEQSFLGGLVKRVFPEDPTHVNVQGKGYWTERLNEAGFREVEVRGCILHGLPPLYIVRRWCERLGIPVVRRPLFFPFNRVCGTLYVFGRKPD